MHVVVGNAGYELSWFANPTPPNYWDKIVMEHGYSRCMANQTTLSCEVDFFTSDLHTLLHAHKLS